MKIIKITQEKQDNGLWGTPFNCYKIDRFIFLDDRKYLLHSALIAAINQLHNKRFEIFNSTDNGFSITTYDSNGTTNWYRISYDIYEVIDDILYEFENEIEHNTFLRRHKIKKLENIYTDKN